MSTEQQQQQQTRHELSLPEERPIMNKDYTIHSVDQGDHSFAMEILDDTSPCFGWVFNINKIIVPEEMTEEQLEDTDNISISIDYSVVKPEEIDLEAFPGGEEDEQVMNSIGPCVIAFIEEAVRQSALSIADQAEEEKSTTDDEEE